MKVCIDVLGHVHTADVLSFTPAVLGESQLTLNFRCPEGGMSSR